MGVAVNVGKREQLAGSSECGGSCTNEKERDGLDGEEIKPTTMRKGRARQRRRTLLAQGCVVHEEKPPGGITAKGSN